MSLMAGNTVKKKHLFACLFGNIFEWYDFVIFGSLASIMAVVFFPKNDHFVATLMTYAIFAVGFLARPIGGIIFGYLADKYGRSRLFTSSILLMCLPMFLMGLLPTYQQVGVLAPILLLFLRLIQGFAMGGEYPVIVTYLSEISNPKHRGFVTSLVSFSLTLGIFFASLTVIVLTYFFNTESLHTFGWRIPFFLSGIVAIFIYHIRKSLPESQLFLDIKQAHSQESRGALFIQNKRPIIRIFGYTVCVAIFFYVFNLFSATYLNTIRKFSFLESLYITNFGIIVLLITIPIAGYLSDQYGRKRMAMIATLSSLIFSIPIYMLISNSSLAVILSGQALFAILLGVYLGPLPCILAEQFNTATRCTSISIGYNLCVAIFGGTGPMVSMYLIKALNTNIAPGIYMAVAAFISLIAAFFLKEYSNKSLA